MTVWAPSFEIPSQMRSENSLPEPFNIGGKCACEMHLRGIVARSVSVVAFS